MNPFYLAKYYDLEIGLSVIRVPLMSAILYPS